MRGMVPDETPIIVASIVLKLIIVTALQLA